MKSFDVIVIGTGGVGSALLSNFARRGLKCLGLDRFPPAHDRGSSHGQTRMIRQAHFEHPDYVPLILRSYKLWEELSQRRKEKLYIETGLLQVGRPDGEVIPGVRKSAHTHKLEIEELAQAEIEKRFPQFRAAPDQVGLFERRAGYLFVEQCVLAHLADAQENGAVLQTDQPVVEWKPAAGRFQVRTTREEYESRYVILATGAWANDLFPEAKLPLTVRRKPLFWYEASLQTHGSMPGFLFENPEGIFYGFPPIDELGLKLAEHTGGTEVADPLNLDRSLWPDDQQRIERFLQNHIPTVGGRLTRHAVCMYPMPTDDFFVIDRHPEYANVGLALGLSGYGFKFVPALAQALTELLLDGHSSLPIDFLRLARPGLHES